MLLLVDSEMKHNTPGVTLDEFIAAKPRELRLGQWFVNCYWRVSDNHSQWLYQLDGAKAKGAIVALMGEYQWETLPEIPVE